MRLFGLATWQLLVVGILSGRAMPIVVELALRRLGSPLGFWMIGQRVPPRTTALARAGPTSAMPR